ncbi:MAG: 3-oxoacyl-[acyl-carrier-protein] synthase III C-terminal domain-containing protein, partial [Pseudomonadota bacterium]
RQSGFPPDRVMNIAADFGNQVAASIPFALDMARREARFKRGDKLLMLGTSAGVSLGGMAMTW